MGGPIARDQVTPLLAHTHPPAGVALRCDRDRAQGSGSSEGTGTQPGMRPGTPGLVLQNRKWPEHRWSLLRTPATLRGAAEWSTMQAQEGVWQAEWWPPRRHPCLNSRDPGPTLLGHKASASVISQGSQGKILDLGWVLNPVTNVLAMERQRPL